MVELATFRIFPRASPGRQPAELAPVPDVVVEKGILTDEAVATRFSQELRARRRAARTDMRQSEAWAEPGIVQPPAASNPGPADLVPALELHGAAAHTERSAPHWLDVEPLGAEFHVEDPFREPLPFEQTPVAAPGPSAEHKQSPPAPPVLHEEQAAPIPEAAFAEPSPAHPPPPAPDPAPPPEAAPTVTPRLENPEPVTAAHATAPLEEAWPAEPPSSPADGATLPIEPPKPELTALPSAEAPVPALREFYNGDSLDLDYHLLGLANPVVVTVTGRLGDAAPIPLTIGRTGLYRPGGFRPAPWSGFAYDVSPDGRTGLALGTRILTARGEIPVEDLIPGDTALALRGPALLPIVWIGRSIAIPPPIEIAANAFGPRRPGKTLTVGADHPIFIQTMPVPARDLVNGGTIRSLDTETAELFHIDVGFAEVLLAEGVPLSSGCR